MVNSFQLTRSVRLTDAPDYTEHTDFKVKVTALFEAGASDPTWRCPAKRPTVPILASLGSLVAGVFRSPDFFGGKAWLGQSSGGVVFLRISSSQGTLSRCMAPYGPGTVWPSQ
jgi:hypothetical protein